MAPWSRQWRKLVLWHMCHGLWSYMRRIPSKSHNANWRTRWYQLRNIMNIITNSVQCASSKITEKDSSHILVMLIDEASNEWVSPRAFLNLCSLHVINFCAFFYWHALSLYELWYRELVRKLGRLTRAIQEPTRCKSVHNYSSLHKLSSLWLCSVYHIWKSLLKVRALMITVGFKVTLETWNF